MATTSGIIFFLLPFIILAILIYTLFQIKRVILSRGDGTTKTLWIIGMIIVWPVITFIYFFKSRRYKLTGEVPPFKPGHLVAIFIITWTIGFAISAGFVTRLFWVGGSQLVSSKVTTYSYPGPVKEQGWKTYTSSQYGFEFQYPPTWNLVKTNPLPLGGEMNGFNISGRSPAQIGGNINMYINHKPSNITIYQINVPKVDNGTVKLTVDGRQAVAYKNYKFEDNNYRGDILLIDDGSWYILFDGDNASFQEDYQQLLPTFKFLK